MAQIIIHVDMDAFFAAVEIRDDPSLAGKPLIIGALPNERGVVATASYEARRYGVHSAMNVKEAYRRCPDGVFMHGDMEKYKAVSKQLHAIWNDYATALEAVAFDEAYLDVTVKAGDFAGARAIGQEIRRRIREELSLSCSVGIGYSKTAAKTASEEKKPGGFFEIPDKETFVNLIIDRDVRVLYTVGEMTAAKLASAGIRTVRDIREHPDAVERLLGKQGKWIVRQADGEDDRPVTPYRPENAKSIGREVTFQKDVNNRALLEDVLFLLAFCVDHRAKRVGLVGAGVTLKLTYADMKSITRSGTVYSTASPVTVWQRAVTLLYGAPTAPVRLVGVSIYNLAPDDERQLHMDDVLEDAKRRKAQETQRRFSLLRERYGLDFEGHLEQIYTSDTLHKTVEYMRRHFPG